MGRKQRLDLQLVELGLAASRQQAQQLIRAGKVRSGDRVMSLARPAIDPKIHPKSPSTVVQGEILAVNGGMGHVGALDVVVLNVGAKQGVTALANAAGTFLAGHVDVLRTYAAAVGPELNWLRQLSDWIRSRRPAGTTVVSGTTTRTGTTDQ